MGALRRGAPATPTLELPGLEAFRLSSQGCATLHPPVSGDRAPGPARTRRGRLAGHLVIGVVAPRTDVGGGARILFEYADRLASRGHDVVVVSHGAPPSWFALGARFIQVPTGVELVDGLPPCDVVLCGYWELLTALTAGQLAPVLHVEQGDFHLFEELDPPRVAAVGTQLRRADGHTAVSGVAARALLTRFGVEAQVVVNAVDPTVFHPSGVEAVTDSTGVDRVGGARRTVLCVGWDGNDFKGIDQVRLVAETLRVTHPDVDVCWVTPRTPLEPAGAIARTVVSPTQTELADLYRAADVYVCASLYEAAPLPPLEAMACGTTVVTTANAGASEYCVDRVNALVVPLGDPSALHDAVVAALDDRELADRCRTGGAATAAARRWDRIIDDLEAICRSTAESALPAGASTEWVAPPGWDATPASEDARSRLEHVMARSGAARLLVPVHRPLLEGVDAFAWEVRATCESGTGDCRVFAPHTGRAGGEHAFATTWSALREDRYDLALVELRRLASTSVDTLERATARCWEGLVLLRLGRGQEAAAIAMSLLDEHHDHTDVLVLLRALELVGVVRLDGVLLDRLVSCTGLAARHPVFLAAPGPAAYAWAGRRQVGQIVVEVAATPARCARVVRAALAVARSRGSQVVLVLPGAGPLGEADVAAVLDAVPDLGADDPGAPDVVLLSADGATGVRGDLRVVATGAGDLDDATIETLRSA